MAHQQFGQRIQGGIFRQFPRAPALAHGADFHNGIVDIVKAKANEIGAQGPQDTGRLMGIVMKEISKKADGSLVSEVVREILG